MDPKIVNAISKDVYRRFPEVDGKKPKVQRQAKPKNKSSASTNIYLLTYQAKVEVQGGKSIDRYVRVVATEKGNIIKMTTSR